MFRSKSPSTTPKLDEAKHDRLKQDNKEPIPVDVSKIESICYKKCIYSLNTPSLSYAERNCLDRCAYKFKEAVDFGHNLALYINYKVRDAHNLQG